MSDGKVIEFADVSMTFGDAPAVDGLTARVDPGRVTAFLGPNGAGKTTTLRILLGELRPTRGRATIGGTEYARIARPAASIGAVMSLEALERARRKTVSKHLAKSAKRVGVGSARVREVLTIVGLAEMAEMRIGSLSLGMKHRLAVAEALLGNPSVLVFDEPANGLDPEGIRWIRLLMHKFADEGRTVLMSSHVLSEVEQVADSLLVLNQGELLFEGPIELLSEAEGGVVTVDAEDRDALRDALDEAGLEYRVLRSGIAIDDATTGEVGSLAAAAGVALSTLTHRGPTLEDVYLQIIDGTWTAPARTAALDPAAFAAPVAGDEAVSSDVDESSVGSDAADDADDGSTADDGGDAAVEADDESAADDAASGEEIAEDDASDAETAEEPEAPTESDDDADELAAMFSDDHAGSAGAATAAAALPGIAGLAGLAHGLRSDDEDGDGDEVPEGVVSPGLERTLSEPDAEEPAASADDDWEAQLLSSMLDEDPEEKPSLLDDSGAFPAASFEVPD
ncbi:MAG: ATP-binding cassette domain-containing protein [Candidatus Microbacterium stercoravium]